MAANSPAFNCVIDANVALAFIFKHPDPQKADALLQNLGHTPGSKYCVPDFFYAECASAIAKQARLVKGYTAAIARADMKDLLALAFTIVASSDLAAGALDVALKYGISGYDALYVALSQRVHAPLITADEKLARALGGKGYDLRLLGELESASQSE